MAPEKVKRPSASSDPNIAPSQLPDRTTSVSKTSSVRSSATVVATPPDKLRHPSAALVAQDMSRSSSNSSDNERSLPAPLQVASAQHAQPTESHPVRLPLREKIQPQTNHRTISKYIAIAGSKLQVKVPPVLLLPVADPELVSKVDVAPPSGMHWSKAPAYDRGGLPLRAHTASLVGNNIYVFGGCDPKTCFNDLYVFDADSMCWSQPDCVGEKPPPLRAMTTTTVGKKLVIFGGGDGPTYYNDVYVFDTVGFRFSKPKITGKTPSNRRAHTACLYRGGLYVFGGGDGVRALNDVWRLDVSDSHRMSWKMISPPSAIPKPEKVNGLSVGTGPDGRPTARGYHTANMVGSKLIIFGGSDGVECFRDVWIYDVETLVWKCVDFKTSFARLSHTSTIVGSYLFVVGGHDGKEYSNEVLLLNLVTMQWDRRKVYGTPPSGRGYHGAVLYDSRLFVIGGFDGHVVFDDTYLLELGVSSYYSQISHFSIDV